MHRASCRVLDRARRPAAPARFAPAARPSLCRALRTATCNSHRAESPAPAVVSAGRPAGRPGVERACTHGTHPNIKREGQGTHKRAGSGGRQQLGAGSGHGTARQGISRAAQCTRSAQNPEDSESAHRQTSWATSSTWCFVSWSTRACRKHTHTFGVGSAETWRPLSRAAAAAAAQQQDQEQ